MPSSVELNVFCEILKIVLELIVIWFAKCVADEDIDLLSYEYIKQI